MLGFWFVKPVKRQFGDKSEIFNVDWILNNIDKLLSFSGVIMVL